jgi:nucleotide-binding universal stress UspA family protein
VKGAVQSNAAPTEAVLRQLKRGQHNLLVVGVSPHPGAELSFGQTAGNLLAEAKCSVLFVTSALVSEQPDPDPIRKIAEPTT